MALVADFVAGRHQDNVRLERLWDADSDAAALQRRIGDVPLAAGAFRSDAGWRGDAVWLCLHCDGPVEPFTRFDALVLMQREEALKAEQDRQKVLAANLEAQSHRHGHTGRVLNTLESVITQADDGLAILNSEPAPDSEQIIAAFTVIGNAGVQLWRTCGNC